MSATSSRSELELIDRFGFDGVGVDDRGAGVAERLIHHVGERVNRRRLSVSRDDERPPAMCLQVFGDSIQEFRVRVACPGCPAYLSGPFDAIRELSRGGFHDRLGLRLRR